MKDETKPEWWRPPEFGWKYVMIILVAVALVTGFGVWLMPNKWAEPEIAAGYARQLKLEREYKAYKRALAAKEAEEARIAKENEEMGLIYIDPGTNPFLPPESRRKD